MSTVIPMTEDNNQNFQMDEFEHKSELLFFGFIRDIKIPQHIVPLCIIQLCYDFYYIDSMKKLKERRETSLEINDTESIFEIEQLILYKACLIPTFESFHKEMFQTVLKNWFSDQTEEYGTEQYRNFIIQRTEHCIWTDKVEILKIIIKHCEYQTLFTEKAAFTFLESRRMNEIICFINFGIICSSFKCVKYLLQYADKLDKHNEKLPHILLNAVKYQHNKIDFIHFIIGTLEKTGIAMKECDDIMTQIIQFDLVDIAMCIVAKGWHKITENDKRFASYLNEISPNQCHKWFDERSYDLFDILNCNAMQITLDDSGWDSQTDDDDFF